MADDTATRLAAYKAHELKLLAAGQTVQTEGQGMVVMAQINNVRAAIAELESQLAAESRSGKRRRGPRSIVADMSR